MSNSSLIENMSRAERNYMENLYESQKTHVWYMSVKILKIRTLAEDCCQMVFMKLIGKIPLLMSFHSDARENAYITVVTRNEAFQVLKKTKKETGVDFELLENKFFTYHDVI